MIRHVERSLCIAAALCVLAIPSGPAAAATFRITSATWDSGDRELTVRGDGTNGRTVTVRNAGSGATLGTRTVSQDSWRVRVRRPSQVPCTVTAQQSGSSTVLTLNVSNAPSNCGPVAGTRPTLSVANVSANEGNTGTSTLTFTVSLSAAAPAGGVSFNFATANGSATSGSDYVAASGSRTIAAGATSTTVPVTINGDTAVEPNETLTLNITGATNTANATASATGTINNDDQTAACNPAATGNHVGCFGSQYTGPAACLQCHEDKARQMHGSVHYQQNGPTDFVTNIAGNAGEGPAGRVPAVNTVIGINTYCGTHQTSPRFTCAGCHVGNGRFQKTPSELTALTPANQLTELANIDCMMCHQQLYRRFPDPAGGFQNLVLMNVALGANGTLVAAPRQTVTRTGLDGIPIVSAAGDFQFIPADPTNPALANIPAALMAITALEAAQNVHATTRQSCLNCHAGAAGANGAKRGDLSTSNVNSADLNLDRHMATTGSNMTCSACHNVDDTPTANDTGRPTTHRIRGRGLDLRANDVATRFTCDSAGCHNASTVHSAVTNGATFMRHTNKVACQTCHIPSYGKGTATEIARDWQSPTLSQTACNGRGGWLPHEFKSSTATPPVPVRPTYQWFDGTSQVYYLTESLANTPTKPLPTNIATDFGMPAGKAAYVMGRPNPNPDNATTRVTGASIAAAKIYPMKEHWGKLARNTSNNTLIAQSTFEYFRTGSFCRAVSQGMGRNPDTDCPDQNSPLPAGAEVVPVHTYQTVNHGVEPQANSLGVNNTCGACHSVNGMTGGPARMDLKGQLGYRVSTAIRWTVNSTGTSTCSPSCHGSKSTSFTSLHSRSQHVSAGCRACHDQITGR